MGEKSACIIFHCHITWCFVVSALDEAMIKANKEEIQIPFGIGICGHVAKTKEIINLEDAYEVGMNVFRQDASLTTADNQQIASNILKLHFYCVIAYLLL